MKKTHTSEISLAAAAMGRLGGKSGTGKAKARTPEQARRAGLASAAKRWGFKPKDGK